MGGQERKKYRLSTAALKIKLFTVLNMLKSKQK